MTESNSSEQDCVQPPVLIRVRSPSSTATLKFDMPVVLATLCSCRATRALSGGYGFNDEAPGPRRVNGYRREFKRLGNELLHAGIIDHGSVIELDVAGFVAGAGEVAAGVAQPGPILEEEETNPTRKERYGKYGIRGALGRRKPDGECIVVVVDQFLSAGQAGSHFAQSDSGIGGDGRLIPVEKGIEL